MTVLVVGGGTMGAGITQVLVQAGERVVLCEDGESAARAARDRVARGLADAEPGSLDLLEVVTSVPDCEAALCVEAVFEDEALKRRLLGMIEAHVPATALLASNTSALSIGALARELHHPERFCGMHFFNPVPRSSLVEVVTGPSTSAPTVHAARDWVHRLGKEEIVVADSPGFATSRLGVAVGLEAIRMLEEGVASADDIDRGMVLGYRFPLGPLRLTDLVGLDVRLAIAEHLATTLGPRFSPPQLLRDKVAAGELGRKSGRGFFDWDRR